MIARRGLITGMAALLAAPAIVRASNIMPVRVAKLSSTPVADWIEAQARYHTPIEGVEMMVERPLVIPPGGVLIFRACVLNFENVAVQLCPDWEPLMLSPGSTADVNETSMFLPTETVWYQKDFAVGISDDAMLEFSGGS